MFKDRKQIVGREKKDFTFKLRTISEDETGVFEGYASVFNIVDEGGDVVEKGAFVRTLNNRYASGKKKLPLLWHHDSREPLGMILEAREDEYGLWVKGKIILGNDKANQIYALMKEGAIDGMSIGYENMKAVYPEDETIDGKWVWRRLQELKLYEISLVTFPMNEESLVNDVKSVDEITSTLNKLSAMVEEIKRKICITIEDDEDMEDMLDEEGNPIMGEDGKVCKQPRKKSATPPNGDDDKKLDEGKSSDFIDDISPDSLSVENVVIQQKMVALMTMLSNSAKVAANSKL